MLQKGPVGIDVLKMGGEIGVFLHIGLPEIGIALKSQPLAEPHHRGRRCECGLGHMADALSFQRELAFQKIGGDALFRIGENLIVFQFIKNQHKLASLQSV